MIQQSLAQEESLQVDTQEVVQAVVLCSGAIYITLNLLADVAHTVLDPRIRHGAGT